MDVQLGVQLWMGHHAPTPKRFRAIQNANPDRVNGKPRGGLWTSTWDGEEQTAPWLDWLRSEQPDWLEPLSGWLLTPRPDARLYVIHTVADLKQCLATYRRVNADGDPVQRWIGSQVRHAPLTDLFAAHAIDHVAIAHAGYAGFHLTDAGQARTRLSTPSLYGWDVESTVWYEWAFTDVTPCAIAQAEVTHEATAGAKGDA